MRLRRADGARRMSRRAAFAALSFGAALGTLASAPLSGAVIPTVPGQTTLSNPPHPGTVKLPATGISGVPSLGSGGSKDKPAAPELTIAPGFTIRLPDHSSAGQDLSADSRLPPGTRFETIGPPPPPRGPNVLDPFPVVRIAGWLTRGGAKIRVLSVRAPGGSFALASCRGRNCPRRSTHSSVAARAGRLTGRIRFRSLQRSYPAGVVLRVFVTKAGMVGKYTRFTIRRGLAPERRDLCMRPGARRTPTNCADAIAGR